MSVETGFGGQSSSKERAVTRVGQSGRTESLAGRVLGESCGLASCRKGEMRHRKPKLLMAAVGGD